MQNVEIAAIVRRGRERADAASRRGRETWAGKKPAAFTDLRKLLEDKSIDAISIATPNHHHTLQTIWACQAGKDVYVEKPCSHDMFEARQIVAAPKKYNRIVQHGTQSRSSPAIAREAVQKMREGLIGDVYMARGLCFKWRDTIGRAAGIAGARGRALRPVAGAGAQARLHPEPLPLQLALVLGLRQRRHRQPGHPPDGCGALGPGGAPTRCKVSAIGGHFMFDDDQETPNTMTATFEFDGRAARRRCWCSKSGTGSRTTKPASAKTAVPRTRWERFFTARNGMVAIWDEDHGKYHSYLGKEQAPGPSGVNRGNNWANFIAAVRSRKPSDLNAPIEEGAISTTLVHLANISYRLRRSLHFDAATYSCPGDEEANAMFRRQYREPFVVRETV